MNDTIEIEKPSQMKMLDLRDIIKYASKNDKVLTPAFFKQHGFINTEINWVRREHPELFEESKGDNMATEKNNNNTDSQVRELREELQEKNNVIEKFKKCFYTDITLHEPKGSKNYVLEYNKIKYNLDNDKFKTTVTHVNVSKYNVKVLERIIRFLTTNSEYTTYRDVARLLIIDLKLDVDIEEFNGGKNRAKYLFPYYYYPLQVLKIKGVVDSNNKKNIVLNE